MPDSALLRLNAPENEQLNWLLGDLLRVRAQQPDWNYCTLLLQLAKQNTIAENAWNSLIKRARGLLVHEEEARQRALELLNPAMNANAFDEALYDFVAELAAVDLLAEGGIEAFQFLPTSATKMPDLCAKQSNTKVFIEVKNLHLPDSISSVAFARWNANMATRPNDFAFTVAVTDNSDPYLVLSQKQKVALERLIDDLPTIKRPNDIRRQLPSGYELRFRLYDGQGAMFCRGRAEWVDEAYIADGSQRLVLKCIEQVRKALLQLTTVRLKLEQNQLVGVSD